MHTDPWMVAVLLAEPPAIGSIKTALGATVERRDSRHDVAVTPDHSLLAHRGELSVLVDVYSRPWQDSVGNDQGPTSPNYLTDPAHNHLLSSPWCLHRAIEQYRGSDGAVIRAEKHCAFVLLRVPVQPGGNSVNAFCDLLEVTERLIASCAGSCFFNPRGETLSMDKRLREICERSASEQLPPLEFVSNTRINPLSHGWSLVDTVGLAQLELVDHEIVFTPSHMSAELALEYARKLAIHMVRHRPSIPAGETASGPSGPWEALPLGQGALAPMRPVIRWLPEDRKNLPKSLELP